MDIPVGDFKEWYLHKYSTLFFEAPLVRFLQSEDEDFCVSKSLASALYTIGFEGGAEAINHYGETQVRGDTVDAIRKVGE